MKQAINTPSIIACNKDTRQISTTDHDDALFVNIFIHSNSKLNRKLHFAVIQKQDNQDVFRNMAA